MYYFDMIKYGVRGSGNGNRGRVQYLVVGAPSNGDFGTVYLTSLMAEGC